MLQLPGRYPGSLSPDDLAVDQHRLRKRGAGGWLPKLLHGRRNRGRARRLTDPPSGELDTQRRSLRDFRNFAGNLFTPAIFEG
jgi:hypothetical protein